MKYRIKQSECQQEGSPMGPCTWVCERTLPGIRLRNIIYQQSLCLISRQSTGSISSQGCSQPPSLPSALPWSDFLLHPFTQAAGPRPCFLPGMWSTASASHQWFPPLCSSLLHPTKETLFLIWLWDVLRFLGWECPPYCKSLFLMMLSCLSTDLFLGWQMALQSPFSGNENVDNLRKQQHLSLMVGTAAGAPFFLRI